MVKTERIFKILIVTLSITCIWGTNIFADYYEDRPLFMEVNLNSPVIKGTTYSIKIDAYDNVNCSLSNEVFKLWLYKGLLTQVKQFILSGHCPYYINWTVEDDWVEADNYKIVALYEHKPGTSSEARYSVRTDFFTIKGTHIKGYVKDEDGQGIGAVSINFSNGAGTALTDKTGYYNHEIPYNGSIPF